MPSYTFNDSPTNTNSSDPAEMSQSHLTAFICTCPTCVRNMGRPGAADHTCTVCPMAVWQERMVDYGDVEVIPVRPVVPIIGRRCSHVPSPNHDSGNWRVPYAAGAVGSAEAVKWAPTAEDLGQEDEDKERKRKEKERRREEREKARQRATSESETSAIPPQPALLTPAQIAQIREIFNGIVPPGVPPGLSPEEQRLRDKYNHLVVTYNMLVGLIDPSTRDDQALYQHYRVVEKLSDPSWDDYLQLEYKLHKLMRAFLAEDVCILPNADCIPCKAREIIKERGMGESSADAGDEASEIESAARRSRRPQRTIFTSGPAKRRFTQPSPNTPQSSHTSKKDEKITDPQPSRPHKSTQATRPQSTEKGQREAHETGGSSRSAQPRSAENRSREAFSTNQSIIPTRPRASGNEKATTRDSHRKMSPQLKQIITNGRLHKQTKYSYEEKAPDNRGPGGAAAAFPRAVSVAETTQGPGSGTATATVIEMPNPSHSGLYAGCGTTSNTHGTTLDATNPPIIGNFGPLTGFPNQPDTAGMSPGFIEGTNLMNLRMYSRFHSNLSGEYMPQNSLMANAARERWDEMNEDDRRNFARALVRKSEKAAKYADIFITKDEWEKLEALRLHGVKGTRPNNKYPGEDASLEDKTVWLVRYIRINAVLDSEEESNSEKGQERSDREAHGMPMEDDKNSDWKYE